MKPRTPDLTASALRQARRALGVSNGAKAAAGPPERQGRGRWLAVRLAAARAEFVADIERGIGGAGAHARFAGRLDHLVTHIAAAACGASDAPVAVAALGGYGRRALCLHSDVDLLIVFDGVVGPSEERCVKAVLHPLWDLRLTVGHQVCSVADFDRLDRGNPEFLLALLDARHLTGDAGVLARVRERIPGPDARPVAEAVVELAAARHARFNDTVYQLEPDVKEAPGGLWDLAAARALMALDGQEPSAGADRERLEEAEDFLLRIRSVLHFEKGRNLNVLTHELQEKAAARLSPGRRPQQQVEALMGQYFRHARAVARAFARARRQAAPAPAAARHRLGRNIERSGDEVGFIDLRCAASEPASWLRVFETALDRGAPVSDATLALIERHAGRCTVFDCLPDPSDRERLLRFLRPRQGLYARLSEMHECGLLARLFPELQTIAGRVIRDFYHKYTVDEHTLLAIRGVERLCPPAEPGRERFGSILAELHAPDVLVLALLFHDVGKWKEEDHAEESVRMAQPMLDRLGVSREVRQDVGFLIGQHLQMARVAFRRDTEDPTVVRQFARLVGTEERLKMLCLMTLADVEAVSAGTLTPWREDLLWRLYVDTYNQLTLGYGDETIEPGQAALAALQASRPADVTEEELARFLEGFPSRYLTVTAPEHVYRHVRLARDIHPDEVHCVLRQERDVWELSVVTRDKPFLFSNISGVLSYAGMDILRGSAMTNAADLVLDIFQFTDREGFFRLNPGAPAAFEALLQDAVAGRQDVSGLIARKEGGLSPRRWPRRVPPLVSFDHGHSQRHTVLEIVAQDAPGLLYRISRLLSRHQCDLHLVLISTEGSRAIDVFHLTRAAVKLSEPAQMALGTDLERMLEEGYEAD